MLRVNLSGISYPGSPIVIDRAEFSVAIATTLGIMGPSGSGKSTLLRMIAGLEADLRGRIELSGNDSTAMLFQDYDCYPWMSVRENVAFSSRRNVLDEPALENLLEDFGLRQSADLWPWQLSGGMRKRLGLLRTIVSGAKLILLDEPFASLDFKTKIPIVDALLKVAKDTRAAVIVVSHSVEDLVMTSDVVLVSTTTPLALAHKLEPLSRAVSAASARERLRDERFRAALIEVITRESGSS